DRQLSKRPLEFDEFEPGDGGEPEAEGAPPPPVRIDSAILINDGRLQLSYWTSPQHAPSSLRLSLRTPGEPRPRVSIPLKGRATTEETLPLPEHALADAGGALLATLVSELEGARVESLPVWVILEGRLTYEPAEGGHSSKSTIEDTGEGLPEWLDELGKRDGVAAVVEYLRHLNIRFHDGGGGNPGLRKFRIKIRDPFRPDVAPDWLVAAAPTSDDLEQAILEFVDRHEKRRLHKHAARGNINGIENFLDIFTTLVRLLYIYYQRGVVKGGRLVGRFCSLIEVATRGRTDAFDGYLRSVSANLGGDVGLLQSTCDETNYLGEVRAALLIAQSIRFQPNEPVLSGPKPTRPRDVLPSTEEAIREAISECGLNNPSPDNVRVALEGYRMLSDAENVRLLAELP
ncbi:MAG: hypothetical protein ABMA14_26100, partial [Hyphomonadaceae bacterium]